jgi:hypothetical protein
MTTTRRDLLTPAGAAPDRINAALRSDVANAKTGCEGTIHDRFVCTRGPGE